MILQLVDRIKESIRLSVPNSTLTENPRFEDFCIAVEALLDEQGSEQNEDDALQINPPKLTADESQLYEPFPLVELQQSFLMGRRSDFGLGGVSTHLYFELRPNGLDVSRFVSSLNALIQRHDMLRAVIVGESEQKILEHVPYYEPKIYAINDSTIDAHLETVRKEMSHQVLPEDKWPLFDFRLTQQSDGEHVIHVSMDLLMLDVRSNQILFRDLDLLYAGRGSDLPNIPISYRDYVIAEQQNINSHTFERAKNYWLDRIASFPLAPDLPLAGNPANIHAPKFKRHLAVLDLATSEKLRERTSQHSVTLSVLLLAVYGLILSRWSKDSCFALNLTMFNRQPLHPCVAHMVGDFTNVSLLALDYSKNANIIEHARTIQTQLWRDAEHRNFSGVNVLRELTRHYASVRKSEQPVTMPVVFTSALPLDIDKDEFEDLSEESLLQHYDEGSSISQTPQVWLDHVASEEEGQIILSWDSIEGLFPPNMIEQMFEQYQSLLNQLAQDDQLWQQVSIDILPRSQRALRETKNNTDYPMPSQTVLDGYLQQVEIQPNAAAIISEAVRLSYAELHSYVVFWAKWLRANGVAKGDYVGIIMEKDWHEPVAVLAINLAGAAYVPINVDWPRARQLSIIETIELKAVVTQPQYEERVANLGDFPLGVIDRERGLEPVKSNDIFDWQLPRIEDCAHVIFTSGSTGKPKGVIISHGPLANTILEIVDRFRLSSKDRALALSSITFDLSVSDMFSMFTSGGALVVPHEEVKRDTQALNALVDQHRVSMINTVPALVAALVDQRELAGQVLPESLRLVMMGGDFIPVTLPNRIRDLGSQSMVIMSTGGPTETVIYSILYEIEQVDSRWASIPYGSAMRNRKCWVVDDQFNDRPDGVPGEIIIGGIGVLADGYWDNEELTQEKFTTHPETDEPVFKTGDIGMYLPSGEIEILGRRDFQVKVNGFRVELSEIERVLSQHKGVRRVVVNAQRGNEMSSSLLAYIVPQEGSTLNDIEHELGQLCRENLPEYMSPHVYVELETLPLSANGKVDRNALPEYVGEAASEVHVEASNETQRMILEIWKELFSDTSIGVQDNFFNLGGHSLIAMQIQTRIRNLCVKECSIGDIFSHPTIVELAQFLDDDTDIKADFASLTKAPQEEQPRPSFAQHRLWFIDQLDRDSSGYHSAYNMPIVWRLEGDLNPEMMRASIQNLLDRHSVFRTVFEDVGGLARVREVDHCDLPWSMMDLGNVKTNELMDETWRLIQQECKAPFDISKAPLMRGLLLKHSENCAYLVITLHHIATDAWSIALMSEEILKVYRDLLAGEVVVTSPQALQYQDFAHWQHQAWESGQMQVYEDYWLKRMNPLPKPLDLPTDFNIPQRKNYLGAALPFELSKNEVESIDQLTSEFRLTTFMSLMSVFSVVLARYSGQSDIVIGTDTANRFPVQTEEMLGYFINQIAIRIDVGKNDLVSQFLHKLRQNVLLDLEHEHMPLDKLIDYLAIDRDISSTPLFQVKLNYHSVADADLSCDELKIENQPYDFSAVQFNLVMTFKRVDDQIMGTLQYRKELFAESSMTQFIEHFRLLLRSLAMRDNWERPVKHLEMQKAKDTSYLLELGGARKRYPLVAANSSESQLKNTSSCRSESLVDRFNLQVRTAPNRIAIQDGERLLTYEELGVASDRLATVLIDNRVAVGDFVGLYLERGPEQVIGILAILKAGAAYVPLDPRSPADRLQSILDDAKPVYVISDQKAIATNALHYADMLIWEELALESIAMNDTFYSRAHAQLTAYIIYTSGTTGQPNGVMVSHHSVTRLFDSSQDFYQFNETDVWSFFHTYVFDVSVWELWGALSYGGKLVIVPYWTCRSAEDFHDLLVEKGVTVLCQTPSSFQQLNQYCVQNYLDRHANDAKGLALRYIIFAGEALDIPSLAGWFDCYGDEQPSILNMYGITETTVHASLRRIVKEDTQSNRSVIGGSLDDLDLYVLNDELQPQSVGLRGELYVAGDGLAQGYRNRPRLTAARFIPNPFSELPGARMYKSGDLARWTYDGELEYLGRIDHQLQIRGHRIELGEIEFHLSSHELVESSIVIALENNAGSTQLVAYWIADKEDDADRYQEVHDELYRWLSGKVPNYMLPSNFVCVESLPLTINGKVDREALTALNTNESTIGVKQKAETQTERGLVAIVCELLALDEVGTNQNFFMIGGHSLLATQFNARIRSQFGVDIDLKSVFEAPNLKQLAAHIDVLTELQIAEKIVVHPDVVLGEGKEEFVL